MSKYAAIIKHAMRGDEDIRVDVFNVPKEVEDIGPHEIKAYVQGKLLGYFEVICVTDRISEQEFPIEQWRKMESGDE